MNILALKFGTHIIIIEMGSCQKIDDKKQFFSHWEGVKVGSNEIFLTTHVGRFLISSFV